MNTQELELLSLLPHQELGENWDLFDIKAHTDSALSFQENKGIILEKLKAFRERKVDREAFREAKMLESINQSTPKPSGTLLNAIRSDLRVVCILADTGQGKTALAFKMLQQFALNPKDETSPAKVYVYKHPNPQLITSLGYNNLQSVSSLSTMTDSVIYFDEPQMMHDRYDKKNNLFFERLCSLARQNDLTLIFSTSDSRWINKGLEAYVSHWFIKSIDINLLKNGCIAKKIIHQLMPLVIDEFSLPVEQFLLYSRQKPEHNGLHEFNKPIYFDDRFSKAYRVKSFKTAQIAQTAPEKKVN